MHWPCDTCCTYAARPYGGARVVKLSRHVRTVGINILFLLTHGTVFHRQVYAGFRLGLFRVHQSRTEVFVEWLLTPDSGCPDPCGLRISDILLNQYHQIKTRFRSPRQWPSAPAQLRPTVSRGTSRRGIFQAP